MELVRFVLLVGTSAWLLLFVVVPLFGTFIPLARQYRRPSWVLFWRLVVRAHLFVLVVSQALLSAARLWPGVLDINSLRWLATAAWIGAALSLAAMAITHPAGMRGL